MLTYHGIPGVSLEMIGKLGGGATKQAVSKSGNPLRWLQSRIRKAILPTQDWQDNLIYRNPTLHDISGLTNRFLKLATAQLGTLKGMEKQKRGRPGKRSLKALAVFLGVAEGSTYVEVLEHFIDRCVAKLKLVWTKDLFKLWRQDLDELLDNSWLPYRPRDGSLPPPGRISLVLEIFG